MLLIIDQQLRHMRYGRIVVMDDYLLVGEPSVLNTVEALLDYTWNITGFDALDPSAGPGEA
jgi:hypothetical protein